MDTLKNETYVMFHVDLSLDKNFCVHNKFLYTLFYPIMCGRSHHITNTWIYFFYFKSGTLKRKQGKKAEKKYFATFTCCCFLDSCYFWLRGVLPKYYAANFFCMQILNIWVSIPYLSIQFLEWRHKTHYVLVFFFTFWKIWLHIPSEAAAHSV